MTFDEALDAYVAAHKSTWSKKHFFSSMLFESITWMASIGTVVVFGLSTDYALLLLHRLRNAAGRDGELRGPGRVLAGAPAEHHGAGDHVVVLNAARIRVTGDKLQQKSYFRHSNYPGGLREEKLGILLERTDLPVEEVATRSGVARTTRAASR